MNQAEDTSSKPASALSQFSQRHPFITASLLTIGSLTVAYTSFRTFRYLLNVNFFRKRDLSYLQNKYGQNSWAVVTGATDGLGKEFALQFAKAQFNLVLLGRSESKMTSVTEEIKAQGVDIQFERIIFDLKHSHQVENFNSALDKGLAGKDISILINNAGISCPEALEELPEQDILDMININCLTPTLITKKVIPLFKKRTNKSAIINVSSSTGVHPIPFHSVYSATKAFLDAFSKSITIENRGVIDVLSLTPHYVSTKLTRYQKLNFRTRSSQEVINAAFRDLGKRDRSFGHFNHEVIHLEAKLMPEKYMENKQKNYMWDVILKSRAIKEALAKRSQRKNK